MPRPTLLDIKERALVRADFPSLANVTFVTNSQLDTWVNSEIAKLHDIIVNSHEDYYLKIHNFTLVANQEAYDLPSDFMKNIKVFYKSSSRRYTIERFMIDELDGFSFEPYSSGTIEMWYVPQAKSLTSDSEEIPKEIQYGWEEYVVLGVAIRCLQKENSLQSAQMLMMERQELEDKITKSLPHRDLGEPHRITDVNGRFRSNNDLLFNEGRQLRYRLMGSQMYIFERIENPGV